jgi:hypothetical protein
MLRQSFFLHRGGLLIQSRQAAASKILGHCT